MEHINEDASELQCIALIDDSPVRSDFMRTTLAAGGWHVRTIAPAVPVKPLLEQCQPDLLIIRFPLSQCDGLSICQEVRGWSQVPILIATNPLPNAIIAALLEGGADDYLLTPCTKTTLLARVRAVLRRVGGAVPPLQAGAGAITLEPQTRRVHVCGVLMEMTPTEYALLLHLMQHAGTALPYDVLLRQMVDSLSAPDLSYLMVYIWHLRQKIEPDPRHPTLIQEITGIGYMLAR